MKSGGLTHIDEDGRARMVDVSDKSITRRRATAEGRIRMAAATLAAIRDGEMPKGDVVAVARLAAIMGAKRTAETVPLCHPLALEAVEVEVAFEEVETALRMRVEASVEGRTGVEMEALCGVSAGLLAVYDMCKAMDRGMEIDEVRLVAKAGGRGGSWRRAPSDDTNEADKLET